MLLTRSHRMGTSHGDDTTGFQSPAQDYIEPVIGLARLHNLRRPSLYSRARRRTGTSHPRHPHIDRKCRRGGCGGQSMRRAAPRRIFPRDRRARQGRMAAAPLQQQTCTRAKGRTAGVRARRHAYLSPNIDWSRPPQRFQIKMRTARLD